jgi:bifunctional non-homologous end joining protein LigD
MLAVAGPLPEGEGWSYELKWDGVRALAIVEGRRVRLIGRSGRDLSSSYPSLVRCAPQVGSPLVLDGEVVAFDEEGRPSFEVLQRAGAGRSRRPRPPKLAYVVFDVLRIGERSLLRLSYDERRHELEAIGLAVPNWSLAATFGPPGDEVLAASEAAGLEGVVAKRRDSPYLPGRRTTAWVKVKRFRTQEVVIGGFTPGRGRRRSCFGALLLGIPAKEGLSYVGSVGSGFDDASLASLASRLEALAVDVSPFSRPLPRERCRGARFVRPVLVGEVRFSEWTSAGRLRQPIWRGLRGDKSPSQVRREP